TPCGRRGSSASSTAAPTAASCTASSTTTPPTTCASTSTMTTASAGSFRAAVVQAAAVGFDRARTLAQLEDLAADAARHGARLTVFPEAFVGGYPRGMTFGTVIGNRTPEGREEFRRYFEGAIEVPGPDVDRLVALAGATGLHLVVGVIE